MKKKLLLGLAAAFLVLAVAIGVFWYFHPTHASFNDRYILGATEEAITEKYGPFYSCRRDGSGSLTFGEYRIRDNTPELVMGYDNSLWYEIYFENGVAVEVRLQEGRRGG